MTRSNGRLHPGLAKGGSGASILLTALVGLKLRTYGRHYKNQWLGYISQQCEKWSWDSKPSDLVSLL